MLRLPHARGANNENFQNSSGELNFTLRFFPDEIYLGLPFDIFPDKIFQGGYTSLWVSLLIQLKNIAFLL
jgi:hypothetical protein